MFNFLKRKAPPTSQPSPQYLVFKSAEAAFEYACKLHADEISEGSGHVGIVLDSRKLLGVEEAVKIRENGIQLATLRIANSDGGFIVPAQTPMNNAPPLRPGDLVLWVAGKYLVELGEKLPDKRSAWVGLIYGVLSPEMRTDTGAFRVALDYYDDPRPL
jgi:hypothetical protein